MLPLPHRPYNAIDPAIDAFSDSMWRRPKFSKLPLGRTIAIPDAFAGCDEIRAGIQQAAVLKSTATLTDMGSVATFMAADQACAMTATEVNTACSAIARHGGRFHHSPFYI